MGIKSAIANRRGFLRRFTTAIAGTSVVTTGVALAGEPSRLNTPDSPVWSPRGTSPYIGEIAMVAFNLDPPGWTACDGQILLINDHQALFSLIGVTYGGDGQDTFGLPDLRGRMPIHMGNGPGLSNRQWGSNGGTENQPLTVAELPAHTHAVSSLPGAQVRGTGTQVRGVPTGGDEGAVAFSATTASQGSGQSHNNMQPFLTIRYIIALSGTFPL